MDKIYKLCIEEAKKSPCLKKGFGCVAVKDEEILGKDCNRFIESIQHLCDGDCIRNSIPSGSDSLIGACGHAEERLIWSLGKEAKGSELYVAGVSKPENKLFKLSDVYFYCIRCAIAMDYAGVLGVNVWSNDRWNFISTYDAIQSSLQFSLKLRNVSDTETT